MKKHNILISFFVLAIVASCNKVLDKQDLQKIPPDLIFNDSNIARLNLDYLYNLNMPDWGGNTGIGALSGIRGELSDESYGESKYFEGTITSRDVQEFGTGLNQTNNWGKIRNINMFIEAVRNSEFEQGTKNLFIGQALFFRAWRYFDLVRIYGGVPLVLFPQNAVGSDAKEEALLPRNSTADCFKQIAADLDTAIMYLPGKYAAAEWGRITKGAAAAFKGRVLLTYASPQFNPNDLAERWQAAYDANLQAKTIVDANSGALHASYGDMWFKEVDNSEAILITGFNDKTGDQVKKNNGYDNGTRPSYLGTGGGSNQPSWEMVKAYPMKDGKMPGASNYTYSDQFFYKDRDPRFEQTIAYNGCTWAINGNQSYRLWTYLEAGNGDKSTEQKATVTGLYCRKAIMKVVPPNNDPKYAGTDWMEIRYAEVLLNLAESAIGVNKIGTSEEGYQGIVAVRKRAGIEAGGDNLYGLTSGLSRADLFKEVLHERQIEFAFEGKRFWDLRRWKLVESTLNGTRRNKIVVKLKKDVSVTWQEFKNPSSPKYRDITDLDFAYTNYFEVIVENNPQANNTTTRLDSRYSINWQPTYYFFPVPDQAIANNPKVVQNNNWGGAFDPLQ